MSNLSPERKTRYPIRWLQIKKVRKLKLIRVTELYDSSFQATRQMKLATVVRSPVFGRVKILSTQDRRTYPGCATQRGKTP